MLVGIRLDEAVERMVKYLCSEQIDISAVTFHAYEHQGKTLLGRLTEIDRSTVTASLSRLKPIDERRKALEVHLRNCGLANVFTAVRDDLKAWIAVSVFENALQKGVSFQLHETGESGVRGPQSYFGVFAAYTNSSVVDVSIGSWALKRGEAALAALSDEIELRDWPHGGKAFSIESEDTWNRRRPGIEKFVKAVMADRRRDETTAESGPDARPHE